MSYREIDSNVFKNREAIFNMICIPFGWMKSDEPIFRHWNKMPKIWTNQLKTLKSEDIKDDNWHLRNK